MWSHSAFEFAAFSIVERKKRVSQICIAALGQKSVPYCSVRFVPDQRPEDLVSKLRSHVEAEFARLKSSNKVSVKVKSVGDWWEADPQSKLFRLAENALYKVALHLPTAHHSPRIEPTPSP